MCSMLQRCIWGLIASFFNKSSQNRSFHSKKRILNFMQKYYKDCYMLNLIMNKKSNDIPSTSFIKTHSDLLVYSIVGLAIGLTLPALFHILGLTVFFTTQDIIIHSTSGLIGILIGYYVWTLKNRD